MKNNQISLTGDLGSGKSAVSRLLSERLGHRIVSTGIIQRGIAEKYGMTTLELNEYTKTHPEIDDEIDGVVSELGQSSEPIIFDSRLAWHFAPGTFKVYLLADPYVAAERILNDSRTSEKYRDIREAMDMVKARRISEVDRFRAYYNIDYADLRNFDLVVETTHAKPEEVAECIIQNYHHWKNTKSFPAFHLSPKNLFPTRIICCSLDKDHADIRVLVREREFYILNGHAEVSKAIAANTGIVPVRAEFKGYDELLGQLRMVMIRQWEDMNFVRFRIIPEAYKDM
jgi:predicted cytidylate kinase